ncbi:unnamed protein product [Soboliphyme baturini]|uniref:Transmembrane protein 11, mitochondrial n=1 Tax=Soboliphyme baturini TaxID=241478 RepID=A0A183ICH9_9BILA|nr:unnamed protein product [Soboliphyme baturini]
MALYIVTHCITRSPPETRSRTIRNLRALILLPFHYLFPFLGGSSCCLRGLRIALLRANIVGTTPYFEAGTSEMLPESAVNHRIVIIEDCGYAGVDQDAERRRALKQLDRALEQRFQTIVIEPIRLGDETSRWIAFGNMIHRVMLLGGFGSLVAARCFPQWPALWITSSGLSVISYLLYRFSWQTDPCSEYQVEQDAARLASLDLSNCHSSTAVVLVHKATTYRTLFHTSAVLMSVLLIMFKLRKLYS